MFGAVILHTGRWGEGGERARAGAHMDQAVLLLIVSDVHLLVQHCSLQSLKAAFCCRLLDLRLLSGLMMGCLNERLPNTHHEYQQ